MISLDGATDDRPRADREPTQKNSENRQALAIRSQNLGSGQSPVMHQEHRDDQTGGHEWRTAPRSRLLLEPLVPALHPTLAEELARANVVPLGATGAAAGRRRWWVLGDDK